MKITIKITHKEFRQLCKDFLADCEEFRNSCKTREEYDRKVNEDKADPYYEGLFHGEIEEDEEIEGFAEALDEEFEEEF